MPAKIVVRNPNTRQVTIDGTYRNLSFNLWFDQASGANLYVPRRSNYQNVVHAYYAEQECSIIQATNGQYDNNLVCKDYYTITKNVRIFEFADKDVVVPTSGARVIIRNGITGVPIFSSAMKPMRVAKMLRGTVNVDTETIIFDEVIEAGRKFAVQIGVQPFKIEAAREGFYVNTLKFSSNATTGRVTIKCGSAYFKSEATGGYRGVFRNSGSYEILILDVSNYDD